MTFLPVKLSCTQEETRAHFPANDICPLVHQNRQVAIGLYPLRVHRANNGFGGWAQNIRFLKFRTTRVGHHRQLWRETFNMLSFFGHVGFGNQHRESSIHMTGFLEAFIQGCLNILPQCPAIRSHNHTAPHRRVISQFSAQH